MKILMMLVMRPDDTLQEDQIQESTVIPIPIPNLI